MQVMIRGKGKKQLLWDSVPWVESFIFHRQLNSGLLDYSYGWEMLLIVGYINLLHDS